MERQLQAVHSTVVYFGSPLGMRIVVRLNSSPSLFPSLYTHASECVIVCSIVGRPGNPVAIIINGSYIPALPVCLLVVVQSLLSLIKHTLSLASLLSFCSLRTQPLLCYLPQTACYQFKVSPRPSAPLGQEVGSYLDVRSRPV